MVEVLLHRRPGRRTTCSARLEELASAKERAEEGKGPPAPTSKPSSLGVKPRQSCRFLAGPDLLLLHLLRRERWEEVACPPMPRVQLPQTMVRQSESLTETAPATETSWQGRPKC